MTEWLQRRRIHPLDLGQLPKPIRCAAYYAVIGATAVLGRFNSAPFVYRSLLAKTLTASRGLWSGPATWRPTVSFVIASWVGSGTSSHS